MPRPTYTLIQMPESKWDVPRTEEGLQQVLRQIEECRANGDEVDLGYGLLALSHLVAWVRSDTDASPFERAHELNHQALEVFQRVHHPKGQLRALLGATSLADPATHAEMLAEAEKIAETTGDEDDLASVLSAKARRLALTDRNSAAELHREVLDTYRRTGNLRGQARSLFALAITEESPPERKRDMALEAAQIYRDFDDPDEASRCMTVAFMNAQGITPIGELEGMAKQGLDDAQKGESRSQEGHWYSKLALIAIANGKEEEAEKYRRWAKDIEDSDGLTPLERWESDVEMTKAMISMAQVQGSPETVKAFREELKRLKANKPTL